MTSSDNPCAVGCVIGYEWDGTWASNLSWGWREGGKSPKPSWMISLGRDPKAMGDSQRLVAVDEKQLLVALGRLGTQQHLA